MSIRMQLGVMPLVAPLSYSKLSFGGRIEACLPAWVVFGVASRRIGDEMLSLTHQEATNNHNIRLRLP
jgi:hypothetical protein